MVADRRRSTSPDRIDRTRPVSASPASHESTADPARSGRAAHAAASETSASGAARTRAKPRSGCYPTAPNATTCTAPGHGSSGCSDSSSTATKAARAATTELENRLSKPSGPPSRSTSTRSGPRPAPRPHNRSRSKLREATTIQIGRRTAPPVCATSSAVTSRTGSRC